MAVLSTEAKKLIAEIKPPHGVAHIATADKSGLPNVSAKGTFAVLDDEHVMFADVSSPRTMANLLENPQVSVMVLNAATRKGCRIWGRAEVMDSGDLLDRVNAGLVARNLVAKRVAVISVDDCSVF